MGNLIQPRNFLRQLKSEGETTPIIMPSDLFEVAELGIEIPLSRAFDEMEFYGLLKKAVSVFNSDAAINGKPPMDFDDLYTKYSEYIEALKKILSD